jgi:hypothetical protein
MFNFSNYPENSRGYNIFEISENIWVFEVVNGQLFTGTLREVVIFAVTRFGLKLSQVEIAINSIADSVGKENYNAVHFGVLGSFIYPFNKDFQVKRMAS